MPFRVLILGGGFTGLEVARRLATRPDVTVTVVDPESHALFTPRLVDALAQACRESDLRIPHATLAGRHGYDFIQGKAVRLDEAQKMVDIERVGSTEKVQASYDTLICAYGASTAFYGTQGQDYAYPFKTWEHLLRLEERLAQATRKNEDLRFAIIGGGATGIEAACALDLRLRALGRGPDARTITVFQAGPQILPGFLPKTVERAHAHLAASRIDVRLMTPVSRLLPDGLETKGGERVPTTMVVWAAGVRPNHVDGDTAEHSPTTDLMTDHALRVRPNVFAGGDVIQLKDGQRMIPKNAQTAMKMGALIAKNVLRERTGKPLRSFRYRSPGVMLWLGATAITDLLGLSLPSRAFVWVRSLFYWLRWRQICR